MKNMSKIKCYGYWEQLIAIILLMKCGERIEYLWSDDLFRVYLILQLEMMSFKREKEGGGGLRGKPYVVI